MKNFGVKLFIFEYKNVGSSYEVSRQTLLHLGLIWFCCLPLSGLLHLSIFGVRSLPRFVHAAISSRRSTAFASGK